MSKPSGLLVHRTHEARDRAFLLQRVATQVGCYLYPIHRIDRAASGIVIFGTSREAARWLQSSLTDGSARKEYLVLARGRTPEAFSCGRSLSGDRGQRQPAKTTFERVGLYRRCSLLRVSLFTGRRHQIRRHLNHLGHHVIGDTTHGKGAINREFREQHGLHRLFLHHTRLVLYHATLKHDLAIHDPLAAELQWVIDRLAPISRELPEAAHVEIKTADPRSDAIANLVREHLEDVAMHSPPESTHAMGIDALWSPGVTLWAAWEGRELLGCAALLELDPRHGEIKSMRTARDHLRKGVASKLLEHILSEARRRSYARLSLETGSMEVFAPARALYTRFGFTPCDPFANYHPDRNSVFMTRTL